MKNNASAVSEGVQKWPTQNMYLMVLLRALGFEPLQRGGIQYSDGVMFYWFDLDEVGETVRAYMDKREILVDIHEVWKAMEKFKSDLRRHSSHR